MELKSLIFNSCQHPVKRFDKNGRAYMVPCNKCEPCLYIKSQKLTARVKQECRDMKYSYFLTLTYNNKNVPLCRLDKKRNRWVPDSQKPYPIGVLDGSDSDSSKVNYWLGEEQMLPMRFNGDSYRPFVKGMKDKNVFAIVSKEDAINFIKRLRRNLNTLLKEFERMCLDKELKELDEKFGYSSKMSRQTFYRGMKTNKEYQNEKSEILQKKRVVRETWKSGLFRYFLTSEYGPEKPKPERSTHRPHYHALLFTNDETVYKLFPRAVVKSWQKCRERNMPLKPVVDEKIAGYVSKYVTGNTTLPAILRTKLTRTFYLSSRCSAIGVQSFTFEKVKSFYLRGTIYETMRSYDGKGQFADVNVRIPNYVLSRYFPKCKEYSALSFNEKLCVYTRFYSPSIEFDEFVNKQFIGKQKYPKYRYDPFIGKNVVVIPSDFNVQDITASRACGRWCKHFKCSPAEYVRIMDWFYYKVAMDNLAQQFLLEELYPDVLHDETFFDDLPRHLDVDDVEDNEILSISRPIMELRFGRVGDVVTNTLHLDVSYFYDDEGHLDTSLFPQFYERNTSRYVQRMNEFHDNVLKSNKSKVNNDDTLHSIY